MSENTLRDALTEAVDAQEALQESSPAPIEAAAPAEVIAETSAQREERVRDASGRFAAKEAVEATAQKAIPDAAPVAQPIVEPPKPPSSWKKDYWEAYQKLDPKLASYIQEREQQFASGVSTYKQEADRAKEIFDAIAPFQQDLQAHNLAPAVWVRQLGMAHQTLVRGSPEQKLQAFQKLAHEYGVPLQNVITGQVDPVMQYLSPLQEQVRQLQGDLTGWKQQQEQQEQSVVQAEIQSFASDKEHFDRVKGTMRLLLEQGLAQDLQGAYDKALRMDDELFAGEQLRKQEDAEKQRRESEAARVQKARANAVSPRTATPTGLMNNGSGKKDLRSIYEESLETHAGSARV